MNLMDTIIFPLFAQKLSSQGKKGLKDIIG